MHARGCKDTDDYIAKLKAQMQKFDEYDYSQDRKRKSALYKQAIEDHEIQGSKEV